MNSLVISSPNWVSKMRIILLKELLSDAIGEPEPEYPPTPSPAEPRPQPTKQLRMNPIYKLPSDAERRAAIYSEATELRGLVVKAQDEAKANQIVEFLKGHQIEARTADGAQFDPHNETEAKGWGVFVEPSEVKAAAKVLQHQSIAKGITFDPYTHTAGKRF